MITCMRGARPDGSKKPTMMKLTLLPVSRKHVLLLAAGLILYTVLYAQPEKKKETGSGQAKEVHKIQFEEGSSWDAALQKAAASHRYIFVDAYASWCAPCKLLKATTFKNREAARFFNQHFINLSIDMEKGEGEQLAAKWEVQSYPTLIIFDAAGKPVLETIGFLKPAELIKFARQALDKKAE